MVTGIENEAPWQALADVAPMRAPVVILTRLEPVGTVTERFERVGTVT
jgi:hypothetical protein